MATAMEEGVFVIATHTWHMVESREKGMMSSDEIKKNIDNVREVIEGISDMNTKPMTLMGILHSDLY
jgi:flagellar biosynthesis component FlhA